MCLAIPMQITEISDKDGIVSQEGVTRKIRLDFVPHAAVGDYVLVHAGVAIERVSAEEAAETLQLIKEMIDAIH